MDYKIDHINDLEMISKTYTKWNNVASMHVHEEEIIV
jgi:hypothetical protein